MRTFLFFSIVVLVLCSVGPAHLLSQDKPYAITLDVPLVSVDVTVMDPMGHAITTLNRYDFEIFDNGEPRPLQNFSPVSTPYNVVLMLDCSTSTRDRLILLVSAMARFADQLRPHDKAVIAAFGSDVQLVVDWDADKKKPLNIPESLSCQQGTNFYNALEWAENKLRGITGRKGVVVFSDGQDSNVARKDVMVDGLKMRRVVPPSDDREFQKVLKIAKESSTPFYFVAVDTDINPGKDYAGPTPDLQQIRARMEQMSDQTGGRIVFPKEARDVVPLFLQIGRELGISYSMAFTPSATRDNKPHKIEVRVPGEDYKVHQSRDSYIVK